MIQAVTFDFWETLMADTPENMARARGLRLEGLRIILARIGDRLERATLEAAYEGFEHRLEAIWQEHRDLPHREQVALFLDTLLPGLSSRLTPATFEEAVRVYIFTPFSSARRFSFPGRSNP